MNAKLINLPACLLLLAALLSCKNTLPPVPYGVLPSDSQLEWQKMELYMFVHFGPNTFTNVEWGDGKEDPRVFNPTALDCRQWAATAKAAGMKAIIITAKHHDGFCLWPSKYSTHTVRESLWKEGKGDVLKELSEACREYGLKFGVYLSPWDRNHPDYGTPAYNRVFANTLTEVLTGYGEVFEQWFDGANEEGASGRKQVYDWSLFNETVYKHQPRAVIFSDVGPGCRWIGNEEGYAGETNWSRLDTVGFQPGILSVGAELNKGNIDGRAWIPGEADTSIRPGWFYSPSTDDRVKSVGRLMDIYYASVGRNANLLLNVPPDRSGRIHPNDSTRLMEFRAALDKAFEANLAQGKISASSTRGNSKTYAAENILDGCFDTYWTTDDEVTTASIELNMGAPRTFNRLLLQEYIPLGQRVSGFNVEYWDDADNAWNTLAEATTIGYKRILCLPEVTTGRIKINITHSLACPLINNLALYHAPGFLAGPEGEDIHKGVSTARWTVLSPVSEDAGRIIDGQTDVAVAVATNVPVVVDLGENLKIKGFFYVPEGVVAAANISRYNFYVSTDNRSWTQLKSEALFNNVRHNPVRQEVLFDEETAARYIKIEPVEVGDGGDKYRIVEIGIIE